MKKENEAIKKKEPELNEKDLETVAGGIRGHRIDGGGPGTGSQTEDEVYIGLRRK